MKRLASLTLLIFLCAVSTAAYWWYASTRPDYLVQPITYDSFRIPTIEVSFDGKTYPIGIDLGSVFQMTLQSSVLSEIGKIPWGERSWIDVLGNEYTSPCYLIPEMQIGDLVLPSVFAKTESDEFTLNTTLWEGRSNLPFKRSGSIGRALFRRKNLFLDFPHSQLVLCSTLDDLKKRGHPVDRLTRVPFTTTSLGVTLHISTDLGIKKFVIDTGATVNIIRSSLIPDSAACLKNEHGLPYYVSSQLIIGGKEFGPINLYLIEISDELDDIDGILGIDFLEKQMLFLDFSNKVVYIGDGRTTSAQE